MATFSERLAYVLSFDTTSGVKSLEKFGGTAEKELSKVDKGFLRSTASMDKFGAGMVAAAGVAGVGLVKLAQGALSTQQNLAALEQVVGETMTHDIGEWAEDAANGLGLSKAAAVDNATAFAQLGKMAGVNNDEMEGFSEGLVSLGADFAAFKNVSPEKAIQDIRSAFSGSVEVMRKYGIFLDDATLKQAYFEVSGEMVTGTLTGQQKVLAVNRELYRQGADMVGQFARESGELSGQVPIMTANLRNLGDQIGSGVLPALTGVVGLLAGASSAATDLNPDLMKAAGAFGAVATGATGAGGAALLSISAYKKAARAVSNFSRAQKIATVGAGAAGLALVAAGLVYSHYAEQKAEATARTNDFVVALQSETEQQDQLIRSQIDAAFAVEGFAEAQEHLGATQQELYDYVLGKANPALEEQIALERNAAGVAAALHKEYGVSLDAIMAFDDALSDQRSSMADAVVKSNDLTEATIAGSEANLDYLDGIVEFTEVAETAIEKEKRLADEARAVTDAKKAEADAFKEARDAFLETFEDFDEASQGHNEALADSEAAILDWADGVNDSVSGASQGFYEFGSDAEVSIASFTEMLTAGNVDVAAWQKDLVAIGEATSIEFAEHVAKMGPEGAALAAELAAGGVDVEYAFQAYKTSAELASTDMVDSMSGAADGVEEQMKRARDAAAVEASLLLVELPPHAYDAGLAFSDALGDGIEAGGPGVVAAAAAIAAAAAAAISRVNPTMSVTPTSSSSVPNFSGGDSVYFHDGGMVGSGGMVGGVSSQRRNTQPPPQSSLRADEVPAVLQTGEYVMSRDEVAAAGEQNSGGPVTNITVQLTGDIYGAPDDAFVAMLAARLNELAAGMN